MPAPGGDQIGDVVAVDVSSGQAEPQLVPQAAPPDDVTRPAAGGLGNRARERRQLRRPEDVDRPGVLLDLRDPRANRPVRVDRADGERHVGGPAVEISRRKGEPEEIVRAVSLDPLRPGRQRPREIDVGRADRHDVDAAGGVGGVARDRSDAAHRDLVRLSVAEEVVDEDLLAETAVRKVARKTASPKARATVTRQAAKLPAPPAPSAVAAQA
jgi:hypothetical protein